MIIDNLDDMFHQLNVEDEPRLSFAGISQANVPIDAGES
jgi:hypothetical protein